MLALKAYMGDSKRIGSKKVVSIEDRIRENQTGSPEDPFYFYWR